MITIGDIVIFLRDRGYQHILIGDDRIRIEGYCQLSNLKSHHVSWAKNEDRLRAASFAQCKDVLIITGKEGHELPAGVCQIVCEKPKSVFFSIADHFFVEKPTHVISPYAIVESESLGRNVSIGHYSFISRDVVIEDGVVIGHHVTIECPARIGEGTTIESGVTIGSDDLNCYQDEQGVLRRAPHTGGVAIGRYVYIGANTTIARGTIGDTVIEDHVNIGNLCLIAHNAHIQKHAMLTAMACVAGSCILEEHVYVAPGAITMNQKTIGKNSFIGMGAVVIDHVPEGKVVAGVPAKIIRDNGQAAKGEIGDSV